MVDQCLTHQKVAKIMESDPGFENLLHELEQLYHQAEDSEIDATTLPGSSFENVLQKVASQKSELSERSKTSKLWLTISRCWESSAN